MFGLKGEAFIVKHQTYSSDVVKCVQWECSNDGFNTKLSEVIVMEGPSFRRAIDQSCDALT
jgi:hypothetical protein